MCTTAKRGKRKYNKDGKKENKLSQKARDGNAFCFILKSMSFN